MVLAKNKSQKIQFDRFTVFGYFPVTVPVPDSVPGPVPQAP